LIFVARVTLGNAENYRTRLYNFPILMSFLFTEKYLVLVHPEASGRLMAFACRSVE